MTRALAGAWLVACVAAAGAVPAYGQSADDADDPYADIEVPLEAEGEVIEVFAERPNKPFDRDTQLRLSGKELAERGATTLADALDVLPELRVREQGRGGQQADIRGARKGAVKVIIDGVPVDEPFYGTFDLSSIPVTDIEQIRVSSSPSSPIDGPGGPGGVVEVHTRDAAGGRMVRARGLGTGLHAADMAATGRVGLGGGWFFRGSASGTLSTRAYDVAMPDGTDVSLDEDRQSATGALRFEHRVGERQRVVVDVSAQQRSFVPPPNDDGAMDVLVIDGETAARASVTADRNAGAVRLHGRAYAHTLRRDSTYFGDATLDEPLRTEHIEGDRVGFGGLINRPHTKTVHLVAGFALDSESAEVTDVADEIVGAGRSTIGELAGGAQLELGVFRVDAAAGVAVPLGVGQDPWPEAKLSVSVKPAKPLTVKVVGARKGRLPSLRERFRTDIGNEDLDPEIATYGEVEVELRPASWLTSRVASYYRYSEGMIRFDGEQMKLINLDSLEVRGVDATVEGKAGRFDVGGSASFTDAFSSRVGGDPLDFLPQFRAATWLGVKVVRGAGVRTRVRYTGTQIDRNEELPGYTTLDLSGFAELGNHLFGTLRIDNATDTGYQARGGVAAPGRTLSLGLQGEW